MKSRELQNINAYKQNYIGSNMKTKPREPETLYRDNYDPIRYSLDGTNEKQLN